MHTIRTPIYRSREEIEQLVDSFERCTLAPDQFNHHAHMTVAIWYLTRLPFPEAVATTRASIRRFAAFYSQGGLYHETITLFWMRVLRHFLDLADPAEPLPDVVYRALSTLGSAQPLFRHYSRAWVFSDHARQAWVDPDLLPLPRLQGHVKICKS